MAPAAKNDSQIRLLATQDVQAALAEDVGPGDPLAGLAAGRRATARIIARQPGVLAGRPWCEMAIAATSAAQRHSCQWLIDEGAAFEAETELARIEADAAALLAAERVALNFLQLLCGVATAAAGLVKAAAPVPVYDTRKTLPKLRAAQKYAAQVGGMRPNRANLHEAVIVKENHIRAAGSLAAAYAYARQQRPAKAIQVEVGGLDELEAALGAGADRIMLDNFSPDQAAKAVARAAGRAELEATGGIDSANAAAYAATGVDRLSSSAPLKSAAAVDLSMLFD